LLLFSTPEQSCLLIGQISAKKLGANISAEIEPETPSSQGSQSHLVYHRDLSSCCRTRVTVSFSLIKTSFPPKLYDRGCPGWVIEDK
jgi:hypothetical protein